jgi:hypothetical protein
MRTATLAPRIGRVVSTISAPWSPARAPRGTLEATVRIPVFRGPRASARGRTRSHEAASRRRRGTIRGRPRRPSANPARVTSTSTALLPEFVTRTASWPGPTSVTLAGDAVSETGGGALPAPAEAGASMSKTKAKAQTGPRAAILTGRSQSA